MGWLIPIAIVAAIAALLFYRKRTKQDPPITISEFWIYLPEAHMPPMNAIMDAMLASNPHNRPGQACIEKREGILFSDIRLHLAMLRREKNPHVFRPDLMFDSCTYEPDALPRLAKAKGLAQVRYVSDKPLADRRHLQFMPHLAGAISRLGSGLAILDAVSEELLTSLAFEEKLSNHPKQENEIGVRLTWVIVPNGAEIRTVGLRKIGLPELRSDPIPDDERTTLEPIWQEVAEAMWRGDVRVTYEAERFGQRFLLTIAPPERGESRVTTARLHDPSHLA